MEAFIHIIGHRKLQNKLIGWYLKKTKNLDSALYNTHDNLRSLNVERDQRSQMVLWDCSTDNIRNLWVSLGSIPNEAKEQLYKVAIFNVPANQGVERDALQRGVQGIFYEEEQLPIFAKGVLAILEGELWYPRDILTKSLIGVEKQVKQLRQTQDILTRRETEILLNVASGANNEQIAQSLCISMHTVKTHIYNIYRKIDVSNRLQASLWATGNL